jgi:ketosteroid isomerase-like protein
MSRENVEAYKRGFEAFNRRDIDAMLEGFDPEIEWHTATDLPDSTVFRGHDGVATFLQEWFSLFEDLHADAEEFIDLGDSLVVSLVVHGRVPGSQESDQEMTLARAHLSKLHEGKIVEIREYLTLEQALEAAGLSE